MNYKGAYKIIVPRLIKDLNPSLHYHNINHTIDVIDSTVRIAKSKDFSPKEILLMKTAALFHDTGMLNTYAGHEEASIEIAKEILPTFGYSENDISFISGMILSTKLPQSAKTIEQRIICDADLDYLGRNDYFMISHQLRYEWELLGLRKISLKDWYQFQINFLEGHSFYTKTAQELRNEGKEKNLKEIKSLFSQMK
ncbi:MAG: HD domain-containing protein [Bacteroidales bacterium]